MALDEEEREDDEEFSEDGEEPCVLRLRGPPAEEGAEVAYQNELAVRACREDEALRTAVPCFAQREATASESVEPRRRDCDERRGPNLRARTARVGSTGSECAWIDIMRESLPAAAHLIRSEEARQKKMKTKTCEAQPTSKSVTSRSGEEARVCVGSAPSTSGAA